MPKVLVVDDEKEITAALRRLLKRSGFEVATACSGEEALSALESFNPDLVLSDFRMPGMNGAALLSEVKRRKPMVLRLIISGYADLDSVLASVNDGEICRFISKPWDDAALPTLLHGLLADRNARATLFQPFANPKQGVSAALYDHPTSLELRAHQSGETFAVANALELISRFVGSLEHTPLNMVGGLLERRGGKLTFVAEIGGNQRLSIELPVNPDERSTTETIQ